MKTRKNNVNVSLVRAAVIAAGACIGTAGALAQPAGPQVIEGPALQTLAAQRGWALKLVGPSGTPSYLSRVVNGRKRYIGAEDINADRTIRTDRVWMHYELITLSSGVQLWGPRPWLRGAGAPTIGVWDVGRPDVNHQEFGGRVTLGDSAPNLVGHSTAVAGIAIAAGVVSNAVGMAPEGHVKAYDVVDNIAEMRAACQNNLRISNHSYGEYNGWFQDGENKFGKGQNAWLWMGDTSISTSRDNNFGYYNTISRDFDSVAYDFPSHVIVKSAGNERDDTGPLPGGTFYVQNSQGTWVTGTTRPQQDGTYDCLGDAAVSKNVVTVGAVNDVLNYTGPSSVVITGYSSFGPTDDGRIKPDVVANGDALKTAASWPTESPENATAYTDQFSGTSAAAPGVAGSVALLRELESRINPVRWLSGAIGPGGLPIAPRLVYPANHFTLSSTYKGLLIHTADECGPSEGPDYQFGWGLVNTAAAAGLIEADGGANHRIQEIELANGGAFTTTLVGEGATGVTGTARVTICWTDPAGTVRSAALDNRTASLVNDLDLRVITGIGRQATNIYPWKLNPASPAAAPTRGDNLVDNVERVDFTSVGGSSYQISVRHKGTLSGGVQRFSLIVSGLRPR
jgi:hypothetical protein